MPDGRNNWGAESLNDDHMSSVLIGETRTHSVERNHTGRGVDGAETNMSV